MKIFTSQTQIIGKKGEDIAARYLFTKGFNIIDRNYTVSCGEVDIIATKGKILHFIEVKSVTRENRSHLTSDFLGGMRPEENFHNKKIERVKRACEIYLLKKNISHETEWQIDLLTVVIDVLSKTANINFIPNAI